MPTYQLARSAHDDLLRRSSLPFVGTRVRLDVHRWSPTFALQLNRWAATQPVLTMLDRGIAMVSDGRSTMPFADELRDGWIRAHQVAALTAPTPVPDACAVFLFDSRAQAESGTSAPEASRIASRPLVQVSPAALFRYHWRRHALALRYPAPDAQVEEDAMALLRHVVARSWPSGRAGAGDGSARRVRHRRLAVAAQALMRADVTALHPIAQLARLLDTSSFHLAHVFRAEVGVSIHQYLMQLRFAVALDCLRHGAPDLSALALELGFSHHSHFSSVFRRAIGWSPREVRRMLTADNVTEFSLATRLCS